MQRIYLTLLIIYTFFANSVFARVLHVGGVEYLLSNGIPKTEHRINVKFADETWFLDLVPTFIPNAIHAKWNDVVYSGCNIESYYYCIVDGVLYWANPGLYLQSGDTQYLNTNYIPTLNTAVEMVMADKSSLTYDLFGVKNGVAAGTNSGFGVLLDGGKFGFFRNGSSVKAIDKDNDFHYYYLSNTDAILDDTHYDFPSAKEPINISRPMYAFGFNHVSAAYDKPMAIRYIKIFENDILVRYLVPVPKDLVIGEFIVPSNGMFDIVEQTFYPVQGVGSFSIHYDGPSLVPLFP